MADITFKTIIANAISGFNQIQNTINTNSGQLTQVDNTNANYVSSISEIVGALKASSITSDTMNNLTLTPGSVSFSIPTTKTTLTNYTNVSADASFTQAADHPYYVDVYGSYSGASGNTTHRYVQTAGLVKSSTIEKSNTITANGNSGSGKLFLKRATLTKTDPSIAVNTSIKSVVSTENDNSSPFVTTVPTGRTYYTITATPSITKTNGSASISSAGYAPIGLGNSIGITTSSSTGASGYILQSITSVSSSAKPSTTVGTEIQPNTYATISAGYLPNDVIIYSNKADTASEAISASNFSLAINGITKNNASIVRSGSNYNVSGNFSVNGTMSARTSGWFSSATATGSQASNTSVNIMSLSASSLTIDSGSTLSYTKTPAISYSNTNGYLNVAYDSTNKYYYVSASTAKITDSSQSKTVIASVSAGYNDSTLETSSTVGSSITINSASATGKLAAGSVSVSVSPSVSVSGSNVNLSDSDNGICVTSSANGTAKVTSSAGWIPTTSGDSPLGTTSASTTSKKYINSITVPTSRTLASITNNGTITSISNVGTISELSNNGTITKVTGTQQITTNSGSLTIGHSGTSGNVTVSAGGSSVSIVNSGSIQYATVSSTYLTANSNGTAITGIGWISGKYSVKSGSIGLRSSSSSGLSGSNATLSTTNNSGISLTASGSSTASTSSFSAGWIASAPSNASASSSTTKYLDSVTIGTGKSLKVNSWNVSVDSSGNLLFTPSSS